MSDRWTDRLSEYIDGDLSAAERHELEGHLAACRECATTVADLRRLVADARSMEDRPPLTDLWPGIAERIGAAGEPAVMELEEHRARRRLARRRFTFSLPQLAAASVALMILSGATAWMLAERTSEGAAAAGAQAGAEAPAPSAAGNVLVSAEAFPEYDAAIAELERLITERRDELDPRTVTAIEENLVIIDQAIAQAQRALAQDPASVYLNEYLAATMRQKLDFLRNAAEMARAAS